MLADHLVVAELVVRLGLNKSAEGRQERGLASGLGAQPMLLRDGGPTLLEGEPESRASSAAGCNLIQTLTTKVSLVLTCRLLGTNNRRMQIRIRNRNETA